MELFAHYPPHIAAEKPKNDAVLLGVDHCLLIRLAL